MQNEFEIKEEKKGMKPSTKNTLISIIFCLVLMPVAVFSITVFELNFINTL